MDPFYYHGFHGFPFFGFLFTLFVGVMIGRFLAFRRLYREQGPWAGRRGCCGPRERMPTEPAGEKRVVASDEPIKGA